jgi:molybdopterin converting factor small subunit
MAKVTLTGNLWLYTAGVTKLEVEVTNIRDLVRKLSKKYPELAPYLEDDLAVAIDGEIYQDDWFAVIGPDSEVHLMPRIGGG